MQTLVACPPFHVLIRALSKATIDPKKFPTLFRLARFINEFSPLTSPQRKVWQEGSKIDVPSGPSIVPQYLYDVLKEFNPISDDWQEDMQEFLLFIVDKLHTELLELGIDSAGKELSNGRDEANGGWARMEGANKSSVVVTDRSKFKRSAISNLFSGEIQSTVRRKAAKHSSSLEPFFCLHLDINTDRIISLETALDAFVDVETLDDFENGSTPTTKQNSLSSSPPILLIHLKRFAYHNGISVKIRKMIEYPEVLTIKPQWTSPGFTSGNSKSYRLFAVTRHLGQRAQGGHYTCYIKQFNGVWLHFDDTEVRPIEIDQVLSETNAYVLAYIRDDVI